MRLNPMALLAILICPLFTACTSPPGMVSVGAIRPTVEMLAPYTTAGIQNDHTLTETQKATLLQELERTRAMLLEADTEASGDKSKVGAVSSRASPEPLALGYARAVKQIDPLIAHRRSLGVAAREGYHEYAWCAGNQTATLPRRVFQGRSTEG